MMPFYSSSTRSKKSKKDGTSRASTASVISSNSHSTKGPKLSVDKPKVDSQTQFTISKSNSNGSTTRPQATQNKHDSDRKAPNVFEYLEDNSTTTDDSSDDEYEHHQLHSVPNNNAKGAYKNAVRQMYRPAAQGTDTRSRTSSIMSKSSANTQKTPS